MKVTLSFASLFIVGQTEFCLTLVVLRLRVGSEESKLDLKGNSLTIVDSSIYFVDLPAETHMRDGRLFTLWSMTELECSTCHFLEQKILDYEISIYSSRSISGALKLSF